jgi:hypothetical protein
VTKDSKREREKARKGNEMVAKGAWNEKRKGSANGLGAPLSSCAFVLNEMEIGSHLFHKPPCRPPVSREEQAGKQRQNTTIPNPEDTSPQALTGPTAIMVTTTQRVNNRLAKAKSQAQRDILYPPSDSESDEDEPEWVGEPLNKDTLIRRTSSKNTKGGDTPSRKATRGSGLSNIPYYNAFKKGDTTYAIGDIVLLRNEQYSRRFDHPYIAQILSLWETEDGDCEGNFRWFHQDEDIAKLRRHQRSGNFPESLECGEIVYTLDDDKNDISTVIGKGQVMNELQWKGKFGEEGTDLPLEERDMAFFCRGVVLKKTGYRPIEWRGNKQMLDLKDEKESNRVPTPAKSSTAIKSIREATSGIGKQVENASPSHRAKRVKVEEEHESEGSDDDVRDQAYSENVSI